MKKINFKNISEELSRNEMKNIMAGTLDLCNTLCEECQSEPGGCGEYVCVYQYCERVGSSNCCFA